MSEIHFLNVEVVSSRLLMHPHTMLRALNGQIEIQIPPGFKVGGRWRFRSDDVDQFIDQISGRAPLEPTPPSPAPAVGKKPSRGRPRKVAASGSAA